MWMNFLSTHRTGTDHRAWMPRLATLRHLPELPDVPEPQPTDEPPDYVPCMFVLALGLAFLTLILTGSFLVAAGAALAGALCGLLLAN